MIKIVKVIQTCHACPSQWDSWDDAGNYYYLRFRHGIGSVEKFESPEWSWKDRTDETMINEFDTQNGLDGYITLQEFCALAGLDLAEDLEYTEPMDYNTPEAIEAQIKWLEKLVAKRDLDK